MLLPIGRIVRYAARRIALDPRARKIAEKAARGAADEAKAIANDKHPVRAAGRSIRRWANNLKNGRRD